MSRTIRKNRRPFWFSAERDCFVASKYIPVVKQLNEMEQSAQEAGVTAVRRETGGMHFAKKVA